LNILLVLGHKKDAKLLSIVGVILFIALILSVVTAVDRNAAYGSQISAHKKQIRLSAIVCDLGHAERWHVLFQPAIHKLQTRHPDLDIQINYISLPYNQTRTQLLRAMTNQTPVDLVSVDQIWLGEFAQKGLLTDLTNYVSNWGRASDWYQANFAGEVYKGKIYGIWTWTDARGIWYWKDLINKAGVDPNSLKTWDGYIASAKKLDDVLKNQGIQGTILFNTTYSPDIWYPYLWMLGGDIIKQKSGHPTKGTYWFPAYNSSAGVRALQFIKEQVNAGIKPRGGNVEQAFFDRKAAVMLMGTWIPGQFTTEQRQAFGQKVGFIPAFPVPKGVSHSATMMGGWELGIPKSSQNQDLAWELISIIQEPEIITPWLQLFVFLPTQKNIGSGPQLAYLNQTFPYYDEFISMIPIGHSRPSIAEYPQIADNIQQAIDDVQFGIKEPKQALDNAAVKSAKVLGW
jgi:multiple sugar transport system substrate-binding protein